MCDPQTYCLQFSLTEVMKTSHNVQLRFLLLLHPTDSLDLSQISEGSVHTDITVFVCLCVCLIEASSVSVEFFILHGGNISCVFIKC